MTDKDDNLDLAGQATKKVITRKFILFLSLLVVLLGVSAVTAMHYTSQPNFCASCHEIAPQVVTWGQGPHKDVTCLECHANPGEVGYVERKLASYKEVFLHFTNQVPNKIEARINIASCVACHSGSIKYPKAKNIKLASGDRAPAMDHSEIIKNNTSCLTCHGNVGHQAVPTQQAPNSED